MKFTQNCVTISINVFNTGNILDKNWHNYIFIAHIVVSGSERTSGT